MGQKVVGSARLRWRGASGLRWRGQVGSAQVSAEEGFAKIGLFGLIITIHTEK